MIRSSFLFIIIAMLIQGCADAPNNEPVTLKLNFPPHAHFQYIQVSKEVLEPEIQKSSFTITQERTIESTYELIPANNGSRQLSFAIDRIAITAGRDNQVAVDYDSRDKGRQNSDLFQGVTNILHKPYTAAIGNNGAITLSGAAAPDTTQAGNGGLGGFNNASVSGMVNTLFNIYPGKPVKTGDSWSTHTAGTIGFVNISAENNYRLLSIDKGIARIEVNCHVISTDADSTNVIMKGVQIGTMDVETATGLIVTGEVNSHINGQIHLGINAPASITSEVRITGKKL